ncbi:MAG: hypothetical protein A3C79_02030 [Candidatus Taylorbacteria bacterium RIFCSPHIGHO2_02_FULL_45_28]|uniref:Acetyltransferase n=1 Tax=Candidatus Taylorbacteria bacterium RIFCSPHIGHO2_12_FULL_45_16 TaxID=1802315 RepID=A0A1G2N2B3_9BACT|nr:MAG: hypothetical protein A2830_02835 [Candidatus Taylorbacteria bacterium RIFCSPHIGHO2_01_FULL_44_110]OHA25229.1 MAG: hypothetical protein A3C79_02030 [Candidatus Taylorbacteria bacterium RIFCSPHIGHO2_02_FULL_45_28]OHA29472.1 MAG: hypothetical protein A3F51_00340 [Candidatus Taylorbacteria bacterium RIFCSPHIGHO2_12_FULL_45_16]OHA33234.1 MAG: hypothetical protein A3A23_02870 [Candidatus Taylorbacteria bacterium RIFCSPLOWO2_01_FULL_45_59]OHA38283.1 MAG: hypothetical protein A3I98_03135 [Candi
MNNYNTSNLLRVGEDVTISPDAFIRNPKGVTIGNHVRIDGQFHITTQAELGNYIHIGPGVIVIGTSQGKLVMGDHTNIALGGRVICGSDEYMGEGLINAPGVPVEMCDRVIIKPVIFELCANVGANVVISQGVTLSEGTVIGACSFVPKNFVTDQWTIYMGIPVKAVKKRPKERMLRFVDELRQRD